MIVNGYPLTERQLRAAETALIRGDSDGWIAVALADTGVPLTRGGIDLPYTAETRLRAAADCRARRAQRKGVQIEPWEGYGYGPLAMVI